METGRGALATWIPLICIGLRSSPHSGLRRYGCLAIALLAIYASGYSRKLFIVIFACTFTFGAIASSIGYCVRVDALHKEERLLAEARLQPGGIAGAFRRFREKEQADREKEQEEVFAASPGTEFDPEDHVTSDTV